MRPTQISNRKESPMIHARAVPSERKRRAQLRCSVMVTAVTAVTRVLITPNRDAAGYADQASDATVSTRKASSEAGTRCRARGGCLAATSVTAPPSRTSTITPKPHQPRRFRQNWPAKTVKKVKVVYALMRATRRSVMGTRLVGGSVRSLCNTSGGGRHRNSRSPRLGRGYSAVCSGAWFRMKSPPELSRVRELRISPGTVASCADGCGPGDAGAGEREGLFVWGHERGGTAV